jgi:hypothetical protein
MQGQLVGANLARLLVINSSPKRFGSPAFDFALQTPFLGSFRRLRRLPPFAGNDYTLDKIPKPIERFLSILQLATILLCLDDNYAFRRNPLIMECQQLFFVNFRQRRCPYIKSQVNSGSHLVDILAPSALRTYSLDVYLNAWDGYLIGYLQHMPVQDCMLRFFSSFWMPAFAGMVHQRARRFGNVNAPKRLENRA